MRNMKKGNCVLEYMVLLAILVMALITMQSYIRRGLCGRYRDAGDTFGFGRQYESGVTVIED